MLYRLWYNIRIQMSKLIRYIQQLFSFSRQYRRPTMDEINSVNFRHGKALKDLWLYDQGKLKRLDNSIDPRRLQNYLREREGNSISC